MCENQGRAREGPTLPDPRPSMQADQSRHIQSDMGAQAARLFGRKEAPTTIEESVTGICFRVCYFAFLCFSLQRFCSSADAELDG